MDRSEKVNPLSPGQTESQVNASDSLRSKRFGKAFRTFDSLFAFLAAGKLGRAQKSALAPIFARLKNKKMPRTCGKPYGNACYAGYASEEMWTCEHKLAMGGQKESLVYASSAQVAKKPFQCSLAHAPVQRKAILRPICVDLCWVAKRWKTWVYLRANLSSIKVNASRRKYTQVMANRSRKLMQVFNLR